MLMSILLAAVNFVEINPGHFHAALVLNRSYPEANKEVRVYAPAGPELDAHLALVNAFNTREKDPTAWVEKVYRGDDFLAKAIESSSRGDVVILAGRNDLKPDYFLAAAKAGLHVISDKPMGIDDAAFAKLEETLRTAEKNGVIVDDVMTERHEIFTIIQKELVNSPLVYGEQLKGSPEEPAIEKLSVHHFCKLVNGKPLQRPAWYYDVRKQGAGIADVTTHLVDIVQWSAFPGVKLRREDVQVVSARAWDTPISAKEYKMSTGLDKWPDYLLDKVDSSNTLQCEANGEFTYLLKGVAVKVAVEWRFIAEPGSGDTHSSIMRGTRSTVSIRQNKETGFRPALFVKCAPNVDRKVFAGALKAAVADIAKSYPGVKVGAEKDGEWRIVIPKTYDIGHEAHFSQEIEEFLGWLKNGNRPDWEASNLEVKYWTINKAWQMSRR